MKYILSKKSLMVALWGVLCMLTAVSCDDDDDKVDAGKMFEGEYTGTLYVLMEKMNYRDTIYDASFSIVYKGEDLVMFETPSLDVVIENPRMSMTMDFGSMRIDQIPVTGVSTFAVTGTELKDTVAYPFSDVSVEYVRNCGEPTKTTVEGKIAAAVSGEDLLVNYTFIPGDMKNAGLSLEAIFIGEKKK